jgi:hypothetical protein
LRQVTSAMARSSVTRRSTTLPIHGRVLICHRYVAFSGRRHHEYPPRGKQRVDCQPSQQPPEQVHVTSLSRIDNSSKLLRFRGNSACAHRAMLHIELAGTNRPPRRRPLKLLSTLGFIFGQIQIHVLPPAAGERLLYVPPGLAVEQGT